MRAVRRAFNGDGATEAVVVDSLVRAVNIDLSDMLNELELGLRGQEEEEA